MRFGCFGLSGEIQEVSLLKRIGMAFVMFLILRIEGVRIILCETDHRIPCNPGFHFRCFSLPRTFVLASEFIVSPVRIALIEL